MWGNPKGYANFASDILRRMLPRVSLGKSTSAPLLFLWLRRTKPQFWPRRRRWSRETHRGAGAVRHTSSQFQFFRPVLPLPLLPQELQRCDQPGTKLQPLVLENMTGRRSSRLPDNPLFLVRSTKCLQLCHRICCAPSRGEHLPQAAKMQNCNALTVQLNRMPSVPLQQDYIQSGREYRRDTERRPMRSYHLALSLVRSLPLSLYGKRRSLLNTTRIRLHSRDKQRGAPRPLRPETA